MEVNRDPKHVAFACKDVDDCPVVDCLISVKNELEDRLELGACFYLHVLREIFTGLVFLRRGHLDVVRPVELHEVFGAVSLQNFEVGVTLQFYHS